VNRAAEGQYCQESHAPVAQNAVGHLRQVIIRRRSASELYPAICYRELRPAANTLRWCESTASQELVSQFNTLLSTDTHFGLLATIKGESLTPVNFLTPSGPGGSFSDKVDGLLGPHLKPNEALYIILRRHDAAPRLVAVTYVPDAAPVRQKMLFAATRLTLVRELGSEHFRETIFATTADELTGRGFERHDAHARLDAPLTEEERSLGEVKRAEQEAGSGTGQKEIHLSSHFAMSWDEETLAALRELAPEGGRTLVMLVGYPFFFSPSFFPVSFPSPGESGKRYSGRDKRMGKGRRDVLAGWLTYLDAIENRPRDGKGGAGPRQLESGLGGRAGPDHIINRAALHLLPIRALVRRQRQQPPAVLLHMPHDSRQQSHQIPHDVPAYEAGRVDDGSQGVGRRAG